MIRIVPFNASYENVSRLYIVTKILLYTSTVLSILISALGYFKLKPDLISLLIGVNILLICVYFFIDNRAHYLFTKAEMKRRLDWLDNSFGTNFSGFKSAGYFTNDHLPSGIHKLAVNCFENSHHSNFILSRMLPGILIQTIIIVLLFILSSYFGNREIIRLFFELSLPAILIQKLVRAIIYSSRIAEVGDRFKSLFNDLMVSGFTNKTPEALRDILEYETTLSWASVPLSSSIFEKNKLKLADEWLQLKNAYNIS